MNKEQFLVMMKNVKDDELLLSQLYDCIFQKGRVQGFEESNEIMKKELIPKGMQYEN